MFVTLSTGLFFELHTSQTPKIARFLLCHRDQSFREHCPQGPLQLNTWIPDPAPRRDVSHEQRLREFLGHFGPEVPANAAEAKLVDFEAQVQRDDSQTKAAPSDVKEENIGKHYQSMPVKATTTTQCVTMHHKMS